jgi:hypothetical protein
MPPLPHHCISLPALPLRQESVGKSFGEKHGLPIPRLSDQVPDAAASYAEQAQFAIAGAPPQGGQHR